MQGTKQTIWKDYIYINIFYKRTSVNLSNEKESEFYMSPHSLKSCIKREKLSIFLLL